MFPYDLHLSGKTVDQISSSKLKRWRDLRMNQEIRENDKEIESRLPSEYFECIDFELAYRDYYDVHWED